MIDAKLIFKPTFNSLFFLALNYRLTVYVSSQKIRIKQSLLGPFPQQVIRLHIRIFLVRLCRLQEDERSDEPSMQNTVFLTISPPIAGGSAHGRSDCTVQ